MATPPSPTKPVALTIGQLPTSRAKKWVIATLIQLPFPGLTAAYVLYAFPGGPSSFTTSVAWRLAPVVACCAYMNVLFLVRSYADLYLPRTPIAVVNGTTDVGMCIGGAILVVVCAVMGFNVKDTRVLAACTAVVAAIIVGLVAFWVWLSRTYSGDASESSSEPPTPSGVARRLPV